jgi:hypothetical protein
VHLNPLVQSSVELEAPLFGLEVGEAAADDDGAVEHDAAGGVRRVREAWEGALKMRVTEIRRRINLKSCCS